MTVFAEQVAVELAVTLSVGAVLGFASGLLSVPEQAGRPSQCRACAGRGAVGRRERPARGRQTESGWRC
jgi:hypothetical protein